MWHGAAQDPLRRHEGGDRGRGQAGPAGQGNDYPVRIVRRERAEPALKTNQERTRPSPEAGHVGGSCSFV